MEVFGGFLLSAANDWEVKAGDWRLVTQSSDELNDKMVPASPHLRIVVEYSHVARTVHFTFECLSVDTCGEVVIGPVAYEGAAIDSPSNRLLVSIGTGGLGNVAGGNLDYISFVPLDAGFGDFSGDGSLDADDIDMLSRAALIRDADLVFDVDRSGAVDGLDVATWVHNLRNTYVGDANLDNLFDARDLVTIFQKGQYDDGVFQNSRWSSGDWNTDGEFSSADLILAFQDGGYDAEPRHPATVPEPTMMTAGLGALAWLNRKRLAG